MRLVSIENKQGKVVVINTEQICRIYEDAGNVVISTGDDVNTVTKFTNVMNAVDYIQRASSVSLVE